MVSLAYKQDELLNSEKLASILKTNPTFVRKIVARLVEAGLVQSFRGKGGGIKLARSPSEISLKDIYMAALDDKTLICTPKKPITKACPVSCSMSEILCSIVEGMECATKTYLSKMNLNDLLKKVEKL